MKKLILLSGKANSGKTHTLKILICLIWNLRKNHSVSIIYPKNTTRLNLLLNAYQNNLNLPSGEYSVIFDIDGVNVGIRTMGDTIGAVWDSVIFFENHKCDIGVLACHDEHLQRSGLCLTHEWEHEKIEKVSASDSAFIEQENNHMAQLLLDEIMVNVNQIKKSTAYSEK